MVKKTVVILVGLVLVLIAVVVLLNPQRFWDSLPEGYYEINLSEDENEGIKKSVNEVLLDDFEKAYSTVELLKDDEVFSDEELEISLYKGEDYVEKILIPNETRKLVVQCDKCNEKEECNFVCNEECSKKNMNFLGAFPLFGVGVEKEGECSCLCGFPSHINNFRLIQAIKKKDVDECGKIEVDIGDVIKKDDCYVVSATLLQDELACEKLKPVSIIKNECYFKVALIKEDVSLCSNIIDYKGSEWSRSYCEGNVSAGKDIIFAVPK